MNRPSIPRFLGLGLLWSTMTALLACRFAVAAEPPVLRQKPPITALTFSPDGKQLLAGSQRGVIVYAWPFGGAQGKPEWKAAGKLETTLAHVHDIVFSPDGKSVAVAGGSPAEHGTLEVFTRPNGKLRFRRECQADVITAVAWSDDGARLATGSMDQQVLMLDSANGETLRQFAGHSRGVLAVAFVGDNLLVSAGGDQSLRVWDTALGKQQRSLDNHTRPVLELAIRPKNPTHGPSVLASIGEDRTVRLWQPTIGRMVRFVRLESAPLSLAWTPGGEWILAGCVDGTVCVVEPDTVKVVQQVRVFDERIVSLAISSQGYCAAGSASGQIKPVSLTRPE